MHYKLNSLHVFLHILLKSLFFGYVSVLHRRCIMSFSTLLLYVYVLCVCVDNWSNKYKIRFYTQMNTKKLMNANILLKYILSWPMVISEVQNDKWNFMELSNYFDWNHTLLLFCLSTCLVTIWTCFFNIPSLKQIDKAAIRWNQFEIFMYYNNKDDKFLY